MDIRDDDLEGGLFEAFKPRKESVLETIQRLHGAGSSILLRETDDQASPVLLRRGDDAAADDSRIQILGEIARGGIGIVYRGRDRDLNRDIALKVLRPEYLDRDEVVQRFIEEAQVGGQLQHPGIVPIYGLGLQSDGRPSFAMKLIKGRTLAELLDANPRGVDLLAVFEQVVQTIAYAHSRGVIHRDLKPANVMVGAFGEVQVVDWGFAKVLGQPDIERPAGDTVIATVRSGPEGSQSVAGSVMGTPAYMPPEQARGQLEDLDKRSDVFALGAILCEILTGRPPYEGEQKDQLIAASQCLLEPARERLDGADAAEGLKDIARACLQPLLRDRPENGSALAGRVAEHFARVEERTRQSQLDALAAEAKANHERTARRRTVILALLALFAVLAGGGGSIAWKRNRDAREARAATAVAAALREARRHEGEEDWTAALAAARKAGDLARSEEVDDGGARELVADFMRRRAAAQEQARLAAADARLLRDLEQARGLEAEHEGNERKDLAFEAAVATRWTDGDVDTRRLAALPRASDFAAAFDAWAHFRRGKLPERDWKRIDGWARSIDPAHNAIRDALAKDDAGELAKLLDDDLPVALISIVGNELDPKEAVAFLRRAHRKHPGDFWINLRLGWAAHRTKNNALATRHFGAALAGRPESIEARHYLGIALEKKGDVERALAVWREALARRPGWTHGITHVAPILARRGKGDEALRLFVDAIRRAPQDANSHYARGQFLLDRLGCKEEALRSFDRALALDPKHRFALDGRASALLMMQDLANAEAAITAMLTLYPKWTDARRRQAQFLTIRGAFAESERVLRSLLEQLPDDAELHALLGGNLMQRGDFEGTLRACRRALELGDNTGLAHSGIAAALQAKFRNRRPDDPIWDDVLATARRAVELAPLQAPFHNTLGLVHLSRNDPVAAIAALERSLELAPNLATTRINLGLAIHFALKPGYAARAARQFRAALALPLDTSRAMATAQGLAEVGAFEDALAAWRKVARLDPRQSTRPAGFLCDSMRRYDEALVEFQRLLEESPGNVWAQSSLGVVLRNKRRFAESVAACRKAVAMAPASAPLRYTLALTEVWAGQLEQALESYAKALELQPAHRAAQQKKRWVEHMLALEKRWEQRSSFTPFQKASVAAAALFRGRVAESARLYEAAFKADPSLMAPMKNHLYRAVWAAARAVGPRHEHALAWARHWLEWRRSMPYPRGVVSDVSNWLAEPDFASIRDADDLPEGWKQFWADMKALRAQYWIERE